MNTFFLILGLVYISLLIGFAGIIIIRYENEQVKKSETKLHIL